MWMQPKRLISAILMLLVGYFLINATMTSTATLESSVVDGPAPLVLFAEGVQTRQFNRDGQLTETIAGVRLEQREGASTTTLTKPKIEFYSDQATTWSVSAEIGSYDNVETFQLSQQVLAKKPGSDSVAINTESLTVDTRSGIVSTKDPVTMTSQHGKLDAVGMTFDTHSEFVQFHANVQTQYEVNNE